MIEYSKPSMPFENAMKLSIHFAKHGHKFGAATAEEYEGMADEFMGRPLNADLQECVSPHGSQDRVRLEGTTPYYGVAYGFDILRTFHVKDRFGVARKGGPRAFVGTKCAEVR
jgi:hypothetical protein